MEYEWDEKKSAVNEAKHGVTFGRLEEFDWLTAIIAPDPRHSHEEQRYRAFGFIGDRRYICVFTWRSHRCRVISLRKANSRERKEYEKT